MSFILDMLNDLKESEVYRQPSFISDKDKELLDKTRYELIPISDLIKIIEKSKGFLRICDDLVLFQIWNKELIENLAIYIKEKLLYNVENKTVLEIGAGDGSLSFHLKNQGLEIHATDSYPEEYCYDTKALHDVEILDYQEALKKYNPEIVIMSWCPYNSDIAYLTTQYPSVKYFIHIGEDYGGCTADNQLFELDYENVSELNIYCIARTDYNSNRHHTIVGVWKK